MPVSKKRPKHALVIRDYAKLEEFAAKFAEGYFNLLILIGDAGITVRQVATLEKATPDTIAFLASDRSEYINAQEIVVDGGIGCTLMEANKRPLHMR